MIVYTLTGQPTIAPLTIVQSVAPSRCRGCWICWNFIRHGTAAAISAAAVCSAAMPAPTEVPAPTAVRNKHDPASLPTCPGISGIASDVIRAEIS